MTANNSTATCTACAACNKPIHNKNRGLCRDHYMRFLRHGNPLEGGTSRGEPLAFLKSIASNPPEHCVIWRYATRRGYGQVWRDGRPQNAHRVSLMIYSGEDPKGMQAAHGPCHDRACINPLHLSWQTNQDNQHDRVRDQTDICGENNHQSKLTEPQVVLIRSASGTHREIGDRFGVSASTVGMIRRRKIWKNVA